MNTLRTFSRWYDRFLFESCDPKLVSAFRIGYALLLVIYVSTWAPSYSLWFTDQGLLGHKAAEQLAWEYRSSLLFYFTSPGFAACGLGLLALHSLLLLVGLWSRVQAAFIFVWLVSFQHRNPLICDGEDTVFRLFALFMTTMPLDAFWAIKQKKRPLTFFESLGAATGPDSDDHDLRFCWHLETRGAKLVDGSAMFYVSRMENYGGRHWLPTVWTETPWMMQWSTWLGLAIELSLPLLLWIKPTRRFAIVLGIVFHLAIESILNLFLFEWIMILGLLTFLDRFPSCPGFGSTPLGETRKSSDRP